MYMYRCTYIYFDGLLNSDQVLRLPTQAATPRPTRAGTPLHCYRQYHLYAYAERAVIITSAVLDYATDAKEFEENQDDQLQYIAYINALAKLSMIPFIKQCLEADSSRWLSLMERHSADSSPVPSVEELVIFLWDTVKDYAQLMRGRKSQRHAAPAIHGRVSTFNYIKFSLHQH